MAIMKKITRSDQDIYVVHCPGCGQRHQIRTRGPEPRWGFNGDMEKPSFTPSLLVNGSEPDRRCHSYITNGQWIFLRDCYHELDGKTVDLPDRPEWDGPDA